MTPTARYVVLRDDPSTHNEVYLTRKRDDATFTQVLSPDKTNLTFASAREGYDFCKHFPTLQSWKVGWR